MTFKTLHLKHKEDYVIIEMDNGKVNAINQKLSDDLIVAFEALEKNEEVKGVILAGRPHCFSAGLDVASLAQGGIEGSKLFWRSYLGALQTMIRFTKPLVCALTGYAPAGATILALCGDYRVMGRGEKHVIGMHEFKMSMQIPEMLCDIYAYQIGEPIAWKAIQEARLYNSDQAVGIGLVDESVEVDEVMGRAEKHLKKQIGVYGPVFSRSKEYFRKGLLKIVDRPIEPMIDQITKDSDDPIVQQMLEMFLASLKK